MDIAQLIRALRHYRGIILVLCASAVINSILSTYVVAEKFKSTALVMMRPDEDLGLAPGPRSKEVLSFPVPALVPFEAMNQTYSEIIKSRSVVERIVRTLHLDQERVEHRWWKRTTRAVKDFFYDTWTFAKYGRVEREKPFEKTVEDVQSAISVTPTKDTYVFEISYTADEPQVTAAVVNTAVVVFSDYVQDLSKKAATQARQSLERELRVSERELDHVRSALREFKERDSIVVLEKEATTLITAVSDLEKDLVTTKKDARGIEAELAELRAQLAAQSDFVKSSATVADNPLVKELKSELEKHEIELAGLSQRLTPLHPKIIALEASIAYTKKRLQAEGSRTLGDETSKVNPVYQTLLENRLAAEAKLEALRAKERTLVAAVASQESMLRTYPAKQKRLDQLDNELALAQNTHKALSQAYDEMRIRERKLEREATLVSAGVVPLYPVKPIKIYYAGVSLGMALLIGVGFALAREALNTRVSATSRRRSERWRCRCWRRSRRWPCLSRNGRPRGSRASSARRRAAMLARRNPRRRPGRRRDWLGFTWAIVGGALIAVATIVVMRYVR